MRRRELIAGVGALGVIGAAGATVYGNFDPFDSGDPIEPVELPRLDASGSPPGTETVPEPDSVTFVSVFATWCGSCQAKMDPLGVVASTVSEAVQFISVTNEPVGQTIDKSAVVDWWIEHDGNWPVAHDDELELTRQVDAPGVPYSIVIDQNNVLIWADAGYKTAEEIRQQIEKAR